jgi:hypothetical protein
MVRLDPGAPQSSVVAVLAGNRAEGEPSGAVQMPPLLTRLVDEPGQQRLVDWITELGSCPAPP